MSLRRKYSHASALVAALLAAASVAAAPPARTGAPFGAAEVFLSDDMTGLALKGFDPVSYFLPGGPKPGRADHQVIWAGVAWRFASAANRAAFAADPWSFAPQIGGYDAEAASRRRLVDADPLLYLVRNQRLYLFRTDANRARFLADERLEDLSQEGWRALQEGLVRP